MSEPNPGTVAVAVACPACGRDGAVAMVTFDRESSDRGTPRVVSLKCPHGCLVDLADPGLLRKLGLAD